MKTTIKHFFQSKLGKSKLEAKHLEAKILLNQEKLSIYTQQIKKKKELLDKMQQQLENSKHLKLGVNGNDALLNAIQEDIDSDKNWEKFISTFNLS